MKNKVLFRVIAAMILGGVIGLLTGPELTVFGFPPIPVIRLYHLIGQLFLNALTLVVVPLVASSIITGTARLGADRSFGILGKRTIGYFLLTGFVAVMVGFFITYLLEPGHGIDAALLQDSETSMVDIPDIGKHVEGGIFDKVEQILYRMIPSNILAAASQGQLLGVIVFSLVFGFFSSRITPELSVQMVTFWKGFFEVMMKITHLVMKALPIGVFGLMAKVMATAGLATIKPVIYFFVIVLAGLAFFMFIVMPLILKLFSNISPTVHFQVISPALLTAFSTSSTAATLPITIECMEKRGNIPNRICSFVLPLGTSINLTGSALYATCAVVFIAQAYDLDLNVANIFVIILMGMFSSMGMVAGIPSASLVTIVVILHTLGVPAEGIVLILPVERILDMFRTVVSVYTNSCCAALVHQI